MRSRELIPNDREGCVRFTKDSERLPGVGETLIPGERKLRLERERRARGIPLGVAVLEQVVAVAKGVGVITSV